jgi:transcription antitermination factor NusG
MEENNINNHKWFLLKCLGGNEHNVIKKLKLHSEFSKYFYDNFIVLSDFEKIEGKKKGPNVFTGYFLGFMENNHLSNNILRSCGAYIIKEYQQQDINNLLENIKEQSNLSINKNFNIRENVKVDMGIIKGEGIIISVNEEKQTAIVEILCFGSYSSVNVPFENLEKIKN